MAANLQAIEEYTQIEEHIEIVEFTEGVLLDLVQRLSPDQLRALPPLAVPTAVLDSVGDGARRDALRWLDELGREPAGDSQPTPPSNDEREAALAVAERFDPASISALRERIGRVSAASRASRFDNPAVAVVSEDLDSVRALAADAGAALAALSTVEATLARAQWDGEDQRERGAAALASIEQAKTGIRAVLGDYHRLEIGLALQAMRGRYADCVLEARTYCELAERVEAIRARLARPAGALGWLLPRRGPSRDERQRLEQQLRRLTRRQKRSHTFVEESEVRQWLDTLVDAGLELPIEQWQDETQEARSLFYSLLNINRLQVTMPANRLAVTLFSRDGTHEPPERCLAGERYLESCFSSRSAAPPADQAREDADGSDAVVQIRATMFAEYRSRATSG